MDVQRAVLPMIRDRWFSGCGAGTFEKAFPYYQPRELAGAYRHAHNEVVQAAAELGTAGAGFLVWAAVAMSFLPVSQGRWQSLNAWESAGIVLALGALVLHGMVDFPFRNPSLCLLAAALVGMSGGQARSAFMEATGCE